MFQLCSSKSAMFSLAQALSLMPRRTQMMGKGKGMRITCQAAIPADNVPDMGKRKLMNLLLLPSGFLCHFLCSTWLCVGSGGQVAKDALRNNVIAAEWLKNHGPGDRAFTQGLKCGLMDDGVKLSLLGSWMALFVLFAGRKFSKPIKILELQYLVQTSLAKWLRLAVVETCCEYMGTTSLLVIRRKYGEQVLLVVED
ncbi:cytochrome b6-f complex iron-sulfur subunit, chloroplastic-like [Rosa rugosa]|uniref:cytochrome b6-f complex iron-sulfur subunit, chloroplastic-like n=1 Tax=Rosa rugosa TaxID=74645 RepID=UPI002B41320A|nr:cytochrome b6-f complex iron-sulfur subunit, chloroplastic-like [Rosa rugosa]XP_061999855.1 cytochrome b6-f complex iron-sulfur subunit, chloroplastic-like [Rosa rugosa]XP_061999856.1 cytochrome b6-f complex iron-sulfur subunit, chloroplastic-like [Rosa rugosa]